MNEVEENKSWTRNQILKEKEFKNSEFIAAIVFNIIFLYIVNNLLNWNLSFIAPTFSQVLFILNISIIANILGNIAFLIYQRGWFRSITQIILNAIGFVAAYTLYVIFPFTFQTIAFAYILKFLLIIGMIGLVIATIVEVLRLVFVNILKSEP